jgi:hypothetical protein
MPKGKYKGQKLIKLVMIKIPARIKRMMATVPEITFVKYNIAIATAASILTTLSKAPTFFFICMYFLNDKIIDFLSFDLTKFKQII